MENQAKSAILPKYTDSNKKCPAQMASFKVKKTRFFVDAQNPYYFSTPSLLEKGSSDEIWHIYLQT